MADSEGESDEEIDVLSNINDQNRIEMFVGTNSSKLVPQTTHPLSHVGGGLQRQKELGFNLRNEEESESDESDSSSGSESDSEDEEEEEDEEDDSSAAVSRPPVLHIRDIHPIKPSEDDLSPQDQDDLNSPDPSPNGPTSINGTKKTRFWEEDPEIYGIRRSGRQRKEPERFNESNDEETNGPVRKKKKSNTKRSNRLSSSEEWPTEGNDNSSGSDSTDSYTPEVSRPRPKPRARARAAPIQANTYSQQRFKAQLPKRNKIKEPAPDSEASDSDDDVSRCSSLRKAALNITSYKEESEDETDSEDVVEGNNGDWQEDYVEDDREMIERILDSRQGRPGEIGAITTVYSPQYEELQKKGPPDPKKEETEEQFLIKWKGWSHLHSTWESKKSLIDQNVKGMKKLDNFMKREKDIRAWKKIASPEDIEYFEVQQLMNSDLIEEYHQVERIIAHTTVSNTDELGNTVNQVDYLCKWAGMPYGESTWEDGSLVSRYFQDKIDDYLNRERSDKIPTKSAKVLRQRPKFTLIKKQPSYIGSNDKLILRDYQLDGLNWLVNSWCKGNSTILADEMGLGKTIQVISFLSYLFHSHTLYGPFLIVVPLSTMAAWQREFALWGSQLNVVVYLGDVTSRTKIREHEFYHKNKKLKINALLSTYEIILKDKHILSTFNWAGLVVDEAHRLKNDDSLLYKVLQEFHTNHRLLVTGTPLQNSLKELWALLHFLMPDKFARWEEFENTHSTQEQKDKGFSGLHKELEPYLLRRVKKDVEKSLPAKVEQILRVEMSSIQKQYYRWILTKNFRALNKGLKGNANSFLNIVMELKKCANHASLIRPLENPQLVFDPLQDLVRGSGKLFLLDKLLVRLKETGHRVLIFSQMVRMLDILAEYLQRRRFLFQRLDGSIRGDLRKKALDHFNAEGSEDFCFLLSTRAGGLGINLATADTVIIFDSDWNPQNDLQAQARAHRIGQRNQVNIYRLVSKGSVEEDIIERAKRKMVLDHLVIQRMDTTGRKVLSKTPTAPSTTTPFNKDELASILKFGAEDLFKEAEGEQDSQLQEMDIDDILRRAELRTSDDQPQTVGEELLSQFKMANFSIDEESINTPEPSNSSDNKTWEEIIPNDIRQKIEEEEKQKEQLALYLPPRSRKTVNKMNYDSEGEPASRKKQSKKKKSTSDSEDDGSDEDDKDTKRKRGRPRTIKREDIEGFNDSEIRKFVKSYKKFGRPQTRLDAIATDAELDDKPKEDIERLSDILHDGCLRAVKEYNEKLQEDPNFDGKKRGATLRIGNVTINAPSILKHEEELEPLAVAIPVDTAERKKYRLTFPAKSVHWGVPWDVSDDSMLLLGIYEHGMGNWEAIKADEGLQLASKILPPGNLKPQDKHLQTRAEYLIKLLKQVMQESKAEQLRKSSATLKTKIKRVRKKDTKKNVPSTDVSPGSSAVPSPAAVASPKVQIVNKEGGEARAEMSKPPPPPVVTETKQKSKKKVGSTKKEKKKAKKEEKPPKEEKEKEKEKKEKKETKVKEEREKKESSSMDEDQLPISSPESKHDNHAHVNSYSADHMDKETFDACKEKMRPVKRALKMLESPEQDVEDKDQVAQTRQCLLKIGDHIMDMTSQYKDHDVASEWRGNLWTFVSKFTAFEAKKLYKLYRHAVKKREETRQQHQQEKSQHKHGQSASKNGKPAASHSGQRSVLKRPPESVSLPGSSSKMPKLDTSRSRFGLDPDDSHRVGHGHSDKSKERPREGHDDRRRFYDRDRYSSHYDHPKTPDRPSDYSRTHERSSEHSRTKDQYSRTYDRLSDHHSRAFDKNYTKPFDKRSDHRDDHYRPRDYSFEHRHHSYSHRTLSESSPQSLNAHSPLDVIHSPRPLQESRKHYSDDKHRDKRS
ncbi:chromodomain-helicase-DNA-binding protein 1-like isoform X2 [Actinia tenebrosa]|uniref:Chromodomain-helicase-DNA-binding protein 1-like isoform X2 n=1 Tax=Actinia tenebrosa TaxID=6105 RepID=A0A6P8IB81_ACTTE|nr:chromodomain-helicase-DNA-binding protein 1-like isoform X2 [Actinia tenebrosa]